MPEQPGTTTFGELVAQGILEIGDGYRAKLEELGGDGPIFLRAGLLSDHGLNWDGGERFHAALVSKLRSKVGCPGDTLVTTKGNSVGRTGYVPENAPSFVYSPHLSYWRSLDARRLSSRFLYHWSQGNEFATQLRAMAHGTDMAPYLSLTDQRRLKITLPDANIQQAVAGLLGALDDKIAVNNRIAMTADNVVRSLYIRDSVDPEGTVTIGDLGVLIRDTVNAGSLVGDENYIGLEHVPRRNIWLSDWDSSSGVVSAKNKFLAGDVLFGKLRPYFHKVGVAFINGVASTDIFVIRPRTETYRGWLLATLASDAVVAHASAVGDGTRMPRARWGDLANFEVPWIDPARAERFDDIVASVMNRVCAAVTENRFLAGLRDTLSPSLMSGEIRVRYAERIVEDVT